MRSRKRNIPTMIALTLVFAMTQVYFGLTFAAPGRANLKTATPQQSSGILTTQDNKPILVNGANTATGATILNGAMIETPGGVSATINVPGHGTINISPNSRVTITLTDTGIKLMITAGCAVLQTLKGTSGEIADAQGVIGKTDPSQDGRIDSCTTRPGGTGAVPGTGGGLSTGAKIGIAAAAIGAGVGLGFGLRGSNPSPNRP